jgi:hypothetical protein
MKRGGGVFVPETAFRNPILKVYYYSHPESLTDSAPLQIFQEFSKSVTKVLQVWYKCGTSVSQVFCMNLCVYEGIFVWMVENFVGLEEAVGSRRTAHQSHV